MDNHEIGDTEAEAFLTQRFNELPKVIQDAIVSADISKHLRELAQTHQLHVDQWGTLEREVQLTLLGLQPLADLAKNLAGELKQPLEQAIPLANDISQTVFDPIREELERQLEHPEAKEIEQTAIDAARAQALAAATEPAASPAADSASVAPASSAPASLSSASITPAAPLPAAPAPVARSAAASPAYAAGAVSHERKEVTGDPYREQL